MEQLLSEFEGKEPEVVFEWNDTETEAKGWLVINSLRGSAAGGGTRMRVGLDRAEVESLAKTMEVKFTVSGPPIGGAKSGINFDPFDPRKEEVLGRWFKAIMPLLKSCYGTGGDLNIDEVREVIPITEGFGLVHPQEGIIHGHFSSTPAQEIDQIASLRRGVSRVIESKQYVPLNESYTIADVVTGYGVYESIRQYYQIWGGELEGKRVIVQGWGNVGAAAAYYLSRHGARIVGIIDKDGGVINDEGYSFEEIEKLFIRRDRNKLVAYQKRSFDTINKRLWDVESDIFIPAAASRLVTKEQMRSLIRNGTNLIACGANVPFSEEEIFFGPITQFVDESASLIPDFIANCGMARVFAYLMQSGARVNDEAIFSDVSQTIKRALSSVYELNASQNSLTRTAFEIALKQLV